MKTLQSFTWQHINSHEQCAHRSFDGKPMRIQSHWMRAFENTMRIGQFIGKLPMCSTITSLNMKDECASNKIMCYTQKYSFINWNAHFTLKYARTLAGSMRTQMRTNARIGPQPMRTKQSPKMHINTFMSGKCTENMRIPPISECANNKMYAQTTTLCQANAQEICACTWTLSAKYTRKMRIQASALPDRIACSIQNFTSLRSWLTTFCMKNSYKARNFSQAKIFGKENPKTKFENKFSIGKTNPKIISTIRNLSPADLISYEPATFTGSNWDKAMIKHFPEGKLKTPNNLARFQNRSFESSKALLLEKWNGIMNTSRCEIKIPRRKARSFPKLASLDWKISNKQLALQGAAHESSQLAWLPKTEADNTCQTSGTKTKTFRRPAPELTWECR